MISRDGVFKWKKARIFLSKLSLILINSLLFPATQRFNRKIRVGN